MAGQQARGNPVAVAVAPVAQPLTVNAAPGSCDVVACCCELLPADFCWLCDVDCLCLLLYSGAAFYSLGRSFTRILFGLVHTHPHNRALPPGLNTSFASVVVGQPDPPALEETVH